MKRAIVFLTICIALGSAAHAQNDDFLRHLKEKDSIRRAGIAAYLKAHPNVKAKYTDRRGRYLYIHHITDNGKPVYYTIRNK